MISNEQFREGYMSKFGNVSQHESFLHKPSFFQGYNLISEYIQARLVNEDFVTLNSCVTQLTPYFSQTSNGVRALLRSQHINSMGPYTIQKNNGVECIVKETPC